MMILHQERTGGRFVSEEGAVYGKLGLKLLRTAWITPNVIWAGALIAAALLTVLL
jgi:hypothetical protein